MSSSNYLLFSACLLILREPNANPIIDNDRPNNVSLQSRDIPVKGSTDRFAKARVHKSAAELLSAQAPPYICTFIYSIYLHAA